MINLAASRPEREISPTRVCTTECHGNLPGAVVKVGVPRGPGAVEGKGQLLVVLVLLTPHPEGGEHFDLNTGNNVSLRSTRAEQTQAPSNSNPLPPGSVNSSPTAARSRAATAAHGSPFPSGDGGEASGCGQRLVVRGLRRGPPSDALPPASIPPPHAQNRLEPHATHPLRGRRRTPPPPVLALALAPPRSRAAGACFALTVRCEMVPIGGII